MTNQLPRPIFLPLFLLGYIAFIWADCLINQMGIDPWLFSLLILNCMWLIQIKAQRYQEGKSVMVIWNSGQGPRLLIPKTA